jgi:hypothetical protein
MNSNDSRDSYYPLDFSGEGSVNVNAMDASMHVRIARPQLYNLREVKEILCLSEWSLNRLLHSNELVSVRIGHRRFVSQHAIEKYIAKREAESEERGNYG